MSDHINDQVDRAWDTLMGLVVEAVEQYDRVESADEADCDDIVERYLALIEADEESTAIAIEMVKLLDQFLDTNTTLETETKTVDFQN